MDGEIQCLPEDPAHYCKIPAGCPFNIKQHGESSLRVAVTAKSKLRGRRCPGGRVSQNIEKQTFAIALSGESERQLDQDIHYDAAHFVGPDIIAAFLERVFTEVTGLAALPVFCISPQQ